MALKRCWGRQSPGSCFPVGAKGFKVTGYGTIQILQREARTGKVRVSACCGQAAREASEPVLQGWVWGMEAPLVGVTWSASTPHGACSPVTPSSLVTVPMGTCPRASVMTLSWQPSQCLFHRAWDSVGCRTGAGPAGLSSPLRIPLDVGAAPREHPTAAVVVPSPGWRGTTAPVAG